MKNPTNFNTSSMAYLGNSSLIWVLADSWSFLSKGVHSLLHVGLLHVTKATGTERERKNEGDLGKLVQIVPAHWGSLRSRVLSVQAKVQISKETHIHRS